MDVVEGDGVDDLVGLFGRFYFFDGVAPVVGFVFDLEPVEEGADGAVESVYVAFVVVAYFGHVEHVGADSIGGDVGDVGDLLAGAVSEEAG